VITAPLPTILLAEDDPQDAQLTRLALRKSDVAMEVVVVRGVEALEYLRREGAFADREPGDPVVLLLDIKMPRKDGLEVLRELKADPRLRRLPVVMLTSSRQATDLATSYDLGVNGYVVKPVDFEDFVRAVGALGVFWTSVNELPPGADG
jgi:CheY-like chemotaxis protein